jgi:ATP-dependent DNA helicase RecG
VQGDVGSGKTLVAALSTLCVALDGYQVAIAAPTEILAAQHLSSFKDWLEPYNIAVGGLSGSQTAVQKRDSLAGLSSGEVQVVIGTHALFQERVSFLNLALVIIDEQHRFGVDQRLSLRNKSQASFLPHQLVMTATPIPRTLAMTQYAELDFSIIDELPPGRIPINTAVVSQKRFETVCERILLACKEGRQAYWVCPLIEESETLDLANAEQRFSELSERLKGLRTGLVHGRLKNAEKDLIMTAFKAGELDMLVATTVIEVGVDVPNATMMVIENPERLGLAQLHQLRGRVGRGSEASYCLLLYGDKLSKRGRERLTTLRESTDGFYIAEKDLEMRGAGEFLGTRQAGDMAFRIADCERDADLLETVHREGKRLLQEEPQMSLELVQRWFGKKKLYAHA